MDKRSDSRIFDANRDQLVPVIPDYNADSRAVPFLRWVREQIEALQRAAARREQNELNANRGQSATIQTLGENIVDLGQRVADAFASLTVRASQIVGPGTIDPTLIAITPAQVTGAWDKPVNTSGTVQADGMLNSIGAYNNDITATRRGAWWRSNGDAGYASSSLEKKVLVDGIDLPDPLAILAFSDTYFHYKAELDKRDNPANPEYNPNYHVALEWGSIAEWAHELGLWQIVVYEDHERPVALHYELIGLLAVRAARHVWAEHLALSARVDELELAA